MRLSALLIPWTAQALRLTSLDDPLPTTAYKVFHVSDTPNLDALLLSAFRGTSSRKLPEPFQSGIERIDLKRATQLNEKQRNMTDILVSSDDAPSLANKSITANSTSPPQLNETSPNETGASVSSNVKEGAEQDQRHWWQRLLRLKSSSASPIMTFIEFPSEGVWDELDDLAAKTGLVHGGSRPYAFQYDIPHGSDSSSNQALWIDTLNHSVLATAHGPNFPIVLALISLCGGSMLVTLVTLLSSPFGKFVDIIRIMNITLYGVLGALLAMYFKSGKLLTAVLTIGFALFPTLLATKRLPSMLTKVTGGLGRFIDIETFLAIRISVTIFSSLCVQALLSISLLIFGSDRLSEHIARHLASSQILFAFLLTLVAAATILPLILELRKTERAKEGMPLTGTDFAYLNTFIHVIVSLAFGVVLVGTLSHLHNYLVFTTHDGEIMLFDPLVFFVPFSTSLFRWHNTLALLGVWVAAGFVFLATADKAWVLQLDNSFSIENNLIESLNGTLREETIHDDDDRDVDRDLILMEPTPRIVPPPDLSMVPPSPPSELENFITPLSP